MSGWGLGYNKGLDLLACFAILKGLPRVRSGGCDGKIGWTVFGDCTGGEETNCKL